MLDSDGEYSINNSSSFKDLVIVAHTRRYAQNRWIHFNDTHFEPIDTILTIRG